MRRSRLYKHDTCGRLYYTDRLTHISQVQKTGKEKQLNLLSECIILNPIFSIFFQIIRWKPYVQKRRSIFSLFVWSEEKSFS